MGPLIYLSHPTSLEHDPGAHVDGHPDTPARMLAIEAAVASARAGGLVLARREAPGVTEIDLERVHDRALIGSIERLSAAGGGRIDADTAVGEVSYLAARRAAGGACALVDALLYGEAEAGFCALRPAGHHAERGRSMGFCLFNNVAIAAEHALRHHALERVMIIDWDVHHGNGTAEIFRSRADVLFASIHEQGLYPGTGPITDAGSGEGLGYTINIPVPRGSDEEVWVSVLEHLIVPAGLEFEPELVLVSAGFDAHRDDPLASCRLESGSFAQLACHVRELARRCRAPVGAVLEGGYEPTSLADSVVATLEALSGLGEAESIAPDPIVTGRAAAHIGHFWDL
jgi:acetoin utilization deacetylase AcuC-like enzyme